MRAGKGRYRSLRRGPFAVRLRVERLEPRMLLSVAAGWQYDQVAPAWFESLADSPSVLNVAAVPSAAATVAASGAGEETAPAQWIVRLEAESLRGLESVAQAADLLAGTGADLRVVRGLGLPGQLLVESDRSVSEVQAALAACPHVASFELDGIVHAQGIPPDDERFDDQWGLDNLGQFGGTPGADIAAVDAWTTIADRGHAIGSRGVVVAVIDSGIDPTHEDLCRNIWLNQGEVPGDLVLADVDTDGLITFYDLNDPANWRPGDPTSPVRDRNASGRIDAGDLLLDPRWADGYDTDHNGFIDDFYGWDFHNNDPDPMDEYGHGTHVAGIIGAEGDNGLGVAGVNWQSSLMALKFLDENNEGRVSDAVVAVNYATMMRSEYGVNVRVTNNSWGQAGGFSPALEVAIRASGEAGLLFVAAAGNGNILGQGVDNDQTAFYPASYALENILSVAASGPGDELAPFSNYGETSVDIAAPGIGILSTTPGDGYGFQNGTSMAAPYVSGVAALVWSEVPDATPLEVREAISQGVEKPPSLAEKVAFEGRLNAQGALTAQTFAPKATLLSAPDISAAGTGAQKIIVQFTDNNQVDVGTIDDGDLLITHVRGLMPTYGVSLVSTDVSDGGRTCTAVYALSPPGGSWDPQDYGDYAISVVPYEVADLDGLSAPSGAIGTFRVKILDPNVFYVDTFADGADDKPGDGVSDDGTGTSTLRSAIQEANLAGTPVTILLDPGTYRLSIPGADENGTLTGDLDISGRVTICGAGAGATAIDARQIDRVFEVLSSGELTLFDLTVAGGYGPANQSTTLSGGGIRNQGLLTVEKTSIRGNVGYWGGGIYNAGAATVSSSTISDNRAIEPQGLMTPLGGGINNRGTLTIANSTISGNLASGVDASGAGLWNDGEASITNCTVFNNSAVSGSGIRNQPLGGPSATVDIQNTIVAGNAGFINPDFYNEGTVNSLGYNLIGTASGSEGDWSGTDLVEVDPKLGPLEDNGGPTHTHALLRGSPAIDHCDNLGAPATDQRGVLRPQDGSGDGTARVDIGAVEAYWGSIRGVRFNDLDGDRCRDPNEPGLPGQTVYLDWNDNGVLDPAEPTTVTLEDDPNTVLVNEAGTYAFDELEPGTYRVAQVLEAGWQQTLAGPGGIQRVSLAYDGAQADDRSSNATISADGRFVAFTSEATNLVADDENGFSDVFLYDRQQGTIQRISVSYNGLPEDGDSSNPSISADGRFVAFESHASNLVKADSNGDWDIFVFDREAEPQGQAIRRVSVASDGTQANNDSYSPSISADGRFVAFESRASNLVPGDGNLVRDVFVYDRQRATIERISVSYDGSPEDGDSLNPAISADGRVVAFQSQADNLVRDDTNRETDIFAYDRSLQSLQRVSVASGGAQANDGSYSPSISADGRYVAFESDASNLLVPADKLSVRDVFVYDRVWHAIERISVARTEPEADGESLGASISADGRYKVFASLASNLIEGDTNGMLDGFLYDRPFGARTPPEVERVTVAHDGSQGNGYSFSAVISADGRYVAFASTASNLVPWDTNAAEDIFVIPAKGMERAASHTVRLAAGEIVGDVDFGNRLLPGEIRGTVFHDADGDAFHDALEEPLAGWTVYCDLDGNGRLDYGEPSTITDADGKYALTDLMPLTTYTVALVSQDGWEQTLPDPDDGGTWTVFFGPSTAVTDRDFGSRNVGTGGQSMQGVLAGTCFGDVNGNGIQDPGEEGLPGRIVYLDRNDNFQRDPDERQEVTAADGTYRFEDLGLGVYPVRVVPEADSLQTSPVGNELTSTGYSLDSNARPQWVIAADFTGEGDLDLAVANGDANTVAVMINNGAGGFASPAYYDAPFLPTCIVAGDFDGQHGTDLAVTLSLTSQVLILLNDGTGSFPAEESGAGRILVSTGSVPRAVTMGDFDGDGIVDLAVAHENAHSTYYPNHNRVSVLLGNGDGTFQAPAYVLAGDSPYSIVAGDFDGQDGDDLAVANAESHDVSVLLNDGNGSFHPAVQYAVGDTPSCIVAGDFDDGNGLDLAVTNFGANDVSVLRNNGNGTFASAESYAAGIGPRALTVVDLEGDGDVDLAVTNTTTAHLAVLRNRGPDELFEPPESHGLANLALLSVVFSVAAGNLIGDDLPDLAVANGEADSVSVLENALAPGAHRVALTGTETVEGLDFAIRPPINLDVDANGVADALTDGVVILRYLFGFTGGSLVDGALDPDATRTDPTEIATFLDNGRETMLDVDANDTADALSDGVIILRYLFGFRGNALADGALGDGATRTDPAEIATFLDSWLPAATLGQAQAASSTDLQPVDRGTDFQSVDRGTDFQSVKTAGLEIRPTSMTPGGPSLGAAFFDPLGPPAPRPVMPHAARRVAHLYDPEYLDWLQAPALRQKESSSTDSQFAERRTDFQSVVTAGLEIRPTGFLVGSPALSHRQAVDDILQSTDDWLTLTRPGARSWIRKNSAA